MSGGPNASVPIPQPDGSGGAGSYPSQLLGVLTGRAAAFLDGEIQRRFGSGLSENVAVDAQGRVRPESQPGTPADTKFVELAKNPATWAIVGGVLVVALLLLRR